MTLPTCCQYHGLEEGGCNQGRSCPARTRRVQESDLRWADGLGVECALPIVTDELTSVDDTADMVLDVTGAILGALALLCILAFIVLFIFNVAPIVRVAIA